MNTSTVSFTSSYSTVSWFFASFDPGFNLVDSIYCPPANTPNAPPPLLGIGSEYIVSDPMTIVTGGYIQAVYFDQSKYYLTNTLFISDVNGIQERPLSALLGSNASANKQNLRSIGMNNKNTGLLDISTLPNENVSFILCGDITRYVADDTAILSLPHGCSGGFIFGNNDSAPSICVAPDVITVVADNWVSDYASPYPDAYPPSFTIPPGVGSKIGGQENGGQGSGRYAGLKDKAKAFLSNLNNKKQGQSGTGTAPSSPSSSSNTSWIFIILIIIIVIVVIALIVFAIFRYRDNKKSGY